MPTGTQAVTDHLKAAGPRADHARPTESAEAFRDDSPSLRELYLGLRAEKPSPATLHQAQLFLRQRLQAAETLPSDLPDLTAQLPRELNLWMEQHSIQVGQQYREYLKARAEGAPRRFFSGRAHALYFLQGVAPTKLVDGAWLYGLLGHWRDPRFAHLIRTYLEELGNGIADKNHVLLYRKLLARHGLDEDAPLPPGHYVQGTIQLALAWHAGQFLPELIGYNLGYEQLPLHLLITAYELDELGIDPYYFTLHVTVDNASTGHARKALQALFDILPVTDDRELFYQRVRNGYRLNDLGTGSLAVIQSFELYQELIRSLARKSQLGRLVHSNYCRLAGRTVNDWLADPAQIPEFLKVLEQRGWIKRFRPPEESRFWRLIRGERAEMFGVFSDYEQQLIHDWILGDPPIQASPTTQASDIRRISQPQSFRARQRRLCPSPAPDTRTVDQPQPARPLLRTGHRETTCDFTRELRQLEEELSELPGKAEILDRLVPLLSPACHHKPPGLMATRIFARLFA